MEVSEYLQNAEENMTLAVEYLDDTLSHIRAGKASARLLDGIKARHPETYCRSSAGESAVASTTADSQTSRRRTTEA